LVPGLLLVSVLFSAGDVRAADEMNEELSVVAKQVSEFLKRFGTNTITVGQFTCPPQLNSSAGPGIAKILAEELVLSGIDVKRLAELGIVGEYRLVVKEGVSSPVAQIKGAVEDFNGKKLFSFTRSVKDTATLASLFGVTADLPASESDEVRNQRLLISLKKPETHVKSTRVSAGASSPYAIEILVKQSDRYVPRPVDNKDQLAFVPLGRDELYAVKLINESNEDAAVTLTIDGLNLFAFAENQDYEYVIVPKKSQGMIVGWPVTTERSDAFQVTSYARSAVAGLLPPDSSNIGTITATFAAAWPKTAPPPPDEREGRLALRGADATGRGPSIEARYQIVERVTGAVRSSVSVRYSKTEK
jgi:hypothetical protein